MPDARCWKRITPQKKGSSAGMQKPETSIQYPETSVAWHQSIEYSIHQLVGLG